jgi:DNA polymerase-1
MEKLLLVDGNGLMHRAYHALPPFKTSKGVPTQVVYGFLSMLHKAVADFQPQYLLVCFDTPAPTFRNRLLESYQAQRPKIDDDFIVQIPFVKGSLDAGRIAHIEKDGYEADDLIGTIALRYKNNGIRVLILSGDKDLLQLVGESISVISPQIGFAKTKLYTPLEVKEKLGIEPHQIPDYKAIAGDHSDNYIGAKGIGPKTTVKLLGRYKTLDNLLSGIDSMEEGKIKTILKEHRKDIIIAKKLSTIVIDVPLDFDTKKTRFIWFDDELKTYLTGFEMYSIMNRIFEKKRPVAIKTGSKAIQEPKPQLSLF